VREGFGAKMCTESGTGSRECYLFTHVYVQVYVHLFRTCCVLPFFFYILGNGREQVARFRRFWRFLRFSNASAPLERFVTKLGWTPACFLISTWLSNVCMRVSHTGESRGRFAGSLILREALSFTSPSLLPPPVRAILEHALFFYRGAKSCWTYLCV
jgi:hypothetical protein